jgi:hypothetical protein
MKKTSPEYWLRRIQMTINEMAVPRLLVSPYSKEDKEAMLNAAKECTYDKNPADSLKEAQEKKTGNVPDEK